MTQEEHLAVVAREVLHDVIEVPADIDDTLGSVVARADDLAVEIGVGHALRRLLQKCPRLAEQLVVKGDVLRLQARGRLPVLGDRHAVVVHVDSQNRLGQRLRLALQGHERPERLDDRIVGEQHSDRVHPGLGLPLKLLGGDIAGGLRQEARAGDREQQSERAAGGGNDAALDEQLPRERGPSGAKRSAHRHLALPRRGARQQQVRDVCARDQQNQ